MLKKFLGGFLAVLLAAGVLVAADNSWRFPVPTLGGLVIGDLIYAQNANNLGNINAVASGQVLTSAGTSTKPAWSASPTLTGGTFSGLTASKPVFSSAAKALTSSGTVPADQGGTGQSSYAIGDIPYASAATTISKLADVAVGSYLASGGVGVAPAYATLNQAAVAGLTTASSPTFTGITLSGPKLTAGSKTGLTVNDPGSNRTQVYKVSLAKETFVAAAVTDDTTIATLPAGTIVHSVVARVTTAFVCAAVCTTATLSGTLGISAGGTEFLASADLDAAIATFGDANAEMGSALSIAGQFNSGYVSDLTGTTSVIFRATSGTGNWGDGAVTNLSAGAVTFYIVATVLP